jgi:hypothetical protein
LIKYYKLEFQYKPGKANVVADALSRKVYHSTITVRQDQLELWKEFRKLNLELVEEGAVMTLQVQTTLDEKKLSKPKRKMKKYKGLRKRR